MEQHQPFGEYQEVAQDARRAGARRDWLIWLITSLGAGLVPFLGILILYRAGFDLPNHDYGYPNLSMLFGGGELLLVILSVTGATLAEFWLNPGHLRSLGKSAALGISVLIGFTAGFLFTAIAYSNMIGKHEQFDRVFIVTLSAILLGAVVIVQSITLLTRPRKS